MCGIYGIIDFSKKRDFSRELEIMGKKLFHRGPDGNGTYINRKEGIWLGHRRLAIIDLSEKGKQPMSYQDGRYWITYNGEVYNYIELREYLESKGYIFTTKTDTEVILAAYSYWGEKCFNKFNGMWALVIWDNKEKRAICSRDRFGIKPFYYIKTKNYFAFASEIKALTAAFSEEIKRDDKMVIEYFKTRYFDYNENTFFYPVKQLRGSYNLIIKNKTISKYKYYQFEIKPETNIRNNIDELKELIIDSIKLRYRSDVEVGSCLSGGIDSSSIVGVSSKILKKKIKTFSAIYRINGYSEEKYVDEMRNQFDINSYKVFPKHTGLLENVEKMIYYQDEPILAYGVYSQWSIMECAKNNGIKVLLDGQGADELFAGYFSYAPYFINEIIRSMKHIDFELFEEIYNVYKLVGRKDFINYSKYPISIEYRGVVNRIKRIKKFNCKFDENTENIHNMMIYRIMEHGLPALLHYEDRNSMLFSIEARVPFLDHRVFEKAINIPFYQKVNRGRTKYVLREAMKSILPEKIYKRKSKLGYPTPFAYWVRKYYKKQYLDIVNNSCINEVLGKEKVETTLNDFFNKNIDNTWKIWQLLALSIWYEIDFFDKDINFK